MVTQMRMISTLFLVPVLLLAACGGSAVNGPVAPTKTVVRTSTAPPFTSTASPAASPAPSGTATPVSGATVVPDHVSGIEGIVLLGPTCPVQRVDSPCPDRPYSATIDIVQAVSGAAVTAFTSGADGRFMVELAPGTYRLVPRTTGTLPRGVEQTVTVADGLVTRVQVSYDTGIR
jgi:hypothetical protein